MPVTAKIAVAHVIRKDKHDVRQRRLGRRRLSQAREADQPDEKKKCWRKHAAGSLAGRLTVGKLIRSIRNGLKSNFNTRRYLMAESFCLFINWHAGTGRSESPPRPTI